VQLAHHIVERLRAVLTCRYNKVFHNQGTKNKYRKGKWGALLKT
jgi:hypothetical protein